MTLVFAALGITCAIISLAGSVLSKRDEHTAASLVLAAVTVVVCLTVIVLEVTS